VPTENSLRPFGSCSLCTAPSLTLRLARGAHSSIACWHPDDRLLKGTYRPLKSAVRRATIVDVIKLLERHAELAVTRAIIRRGGVLLIVGHAGIGKTTMLDMACSIAERQKRLVLRARGSDLESDFPFGIIRQLFERHCSRLMRNEGAMLLRGPARAVRWLVTGSRLQEVKADRSFAIVHGLYWLTANLAARRPLLLAVDDAHWSDDASLRSLAYLAARLEGIDVSIILSLRPDAPRSNTQSLLALQGAASATVRPAPLSAQAVATVARRTVGARADSDFCAAIHHLTGGNPFYVQELLRALKAADHYGGPASIEQVLGRSDEDGISVKLGTRLRALDPRCLRLAQAIAVLGDRCDLRHAAGIAQMGTTQAIQVATELVRLDVLGKDRPPHFMHPIVQHAVSQTLSSAEHDAAHRAAARVLHTDRSPPGQIAAHLMKVRAAGDPWIVERLREAGRSALANGSPAAAADLLERALSEPPTADLRPEVLREAAWAHLAAGRALACQRLEEAAAIAEDAVHPELDLELARAYATLFRWADAVRVLEHALKSLGDTHRAMAALLQSELAVVGLQDASTATSAVQAMKHLSHGRLAQAPASGLSGAQGMLAILTGQPSEDAVLPLNRALAATQYVENWDMRAALWWSLLVAEQYLTVESSLAVFREQVDRSGSCRGLIAVYSTLAMLKLRLGALPEADAAARIALQVARESDFAPGVPFAATVLADVAVASGELDEAQALLDLLPGGTLPPSVSSALIPAGRGRLRLAQGRGAEALAEFEACMALWQPAKWGLAMRDVGYLHARSGAALALLTIGNLPRAHQLAEAEVHDVQRFGGRRALGVALRVAGLARGGKAGLNALEESVEVLSRSPALLERARSLTEWGAALRRAGYRREARTVLSRGLDVAAHCGARPLIGRAREELHLAGARPRRDWTSGVEALTPSELRIAQLARIGRSNRQIAQDLYLSIKTVEGHLARAYGKLGISTRRDLDQVLEPEKTRVPTL
jgi:DNA-binding CsgD family transcriptional regulator/energy-coupling factor transporter ATP-binding protein EcfA2